MAGPRTSSTDSFYTLGLEPPQELNHRARRLKQYLESWGMVADPTPPSIVLTCTPRGLSPPVTGRLPRCEMAPVMGRCLAIENAVSTREKPWVIWPIDLGHWYAELRESLLTPHLSDEDPSMGPEVPTGGAFILLACVHGKPLDLASILRNQEIASLLEPASGWRSMTLSCRRIEVVPNRPWYLSAYWQTQWTRRLRRSPKANWLLI